MFDFDSVNNVSGLVTSIGAALGGVWKFIDWLRERPSKAKLEAARQLAQWSREAADSSSIRGFGEQELLRLHFKDLTGIDRRDDHAALLRAHAKLGGTDYDWRRLKGVAVYLERSGTEIVVRKLKGWDYALAAASVALVLMCLGSGLFFIEGSMDVASSDKGTLAGRLIASVVLGGFAAGSIVIAWLFFVVVWNMFASPGDIREKLAASHEIEALRD